MHAQSKTTLQSDPDGASKRLCPSPATPCTLGFLNPDTALSRLPATGYLPAESLKHPVPAPSHCHGYPQQAVPREAQSILGPARRLGGTYVALQHVPCSPDILQAGKLVICQPPLWGHTAVREGFQLKVASLPVWYPVQRLLRACQLVISC